MQKIPTLFERDWEGDRSRVTEQVVPGCEWVLDGEGIATRKFDGTCCMFDGEKWWARREVKDGKPTPPGFVSSEHDTICSPCRLAGWEPAIGGNCAVQRSGDETGLSQSVVREEGCGGSDVSGEMERQQELTSREVRDLRQEVQGSKGATDLRQISWVSSGSQKTSIPAGQSEALASGSREPGQGDDLSLRLPDGLSTRPSCPKQESQYPRTQSGNGDDLGPILVAAGESSSSERGQGRQSAGESRTLDTSASTRSAPQRNSTLRNMHLCCVCGVNVVTLKNVGWEPIEQSSFAKFHAQALLDTEFRAQPGTYELCGPKVQGNPEHFDSHVLIRHADADPYIVPRTFGGMRDLLMELDVEGFVFHNEDGRRMAKIKGRDFGLKR